jgi:hypothetical protein
MPPAKKLSPEELQQKEVTKFVKNLWFFSFYFIMLLMIASFGLIAEV